MFDGFAAFPIELPGRVRCLRSFMPLTALALDGAANSGWAHVAMLGAWEGHSKGSFAFTQQAFSEILRNFSAQANPIPWDYEHDTFSQTTTGPKPASGWVKRLELRNNNTELWAYVDWTPRAAEMIRNGEYRFCSPVVDFESIDRRTNKVIGAELLSVALTNNPFLDGQHPLQLTWVAASYPGAAPMAQWPPDPNKPQQGQQQPWPPQHGQQQPPPNPHAPPAHGQQGQQQPVNPHVPPQPMAAAEPKGPPPPNAPPMPPNPHVPPPPPGPPGPPDKAAGDAAAGDGAEADANSFLSALADAAGIDKSQTLAALLDIKDLLVQQIQKTIARDGTPAEARRMTTDKKLETPAAAAAAPASATPAAVAAPAAVPPATTASPADALTMDELERKRDKERLAEMQARLETIERERAAEKQQAIAQLVDEKIATGYVRADQRDTAIWAFTTDRTRAEQIYADKLVPIGTRQTQSVGGIVPNQTAATVNGSDEFDETQFSRAELLTIACLQGAHKSRKDAVAIVMNKRSVRAN